MIIIKLIGGLGNQMFQYAFGKKLSIQQNTPLKIDIRGLITNHSKSNVTYRHFGLKTFELNANIATSKDFSLFENSAKYLYQKFKKKLVNPQRIKEGTIQIHFNEITSKNLYVEGYWQSEKYFLDIKKQLLTDFQFKTPPNEYYSQIISHLNHKNTVSVHVRRGDYASNAITNAFHGTCSVEYYNAAINLISKKIEKPYFIVISDDIEWCKVNLSHISNCIFVENNKGEDYEDMRLMSLCNHNIIANSSFSWWGAWLNTNIDKIVIAPMQWFADKKMQEDSKDLIPNSWIKL